MFSWVWAGLASTSVAVAGVDYWYTPGASLEDDASIMLVNVDPGYALQPKTRYAVTLYTEGGADQLIYPPHYISRDFYDCEGRREQGWDPIYR